MRCARALRRAGADHVELSTAGDWLRIFAGHLRRSEAALRAGAPARAAVRNRLQAGALVSFAEPVLLAGFILSRSRCSPTGRCSGAGGASRRRGATRR